MKNQKGITLITFTIIVIGVLILGYFFISNMLNNKTDKIKADMEAKLHTIYFDTDGGKKISPKRVESFSAISNVSAEKNGYVFKEWLLDGEPIEYTPTSLKQDVTLKASYIKANNTNDYSSNNNSIASNKNVSNNDFIESNNDLDNNSNNNTYYSTSSNNNSANSNTNNTYSQNQPENKKTYNVDKRQGQVDHLGTELCALTVMSYQTESYNAEVGKVKDGQEWVIVNMKFENLSDSTIVIDKNDFKIVDGAGRYGYRPWSKHLDTELDMIEVRAGQTATFKVRFVYYQNNEMILRFRHPSIVSDVYTEIKLR